MERSELILSRGWGGEPDEVRESTALVGFRPNSFQAGISCWRDRFPRQQLWDTLKHGTLKATYPEVHNGSIRFRVKLQSQASRKWMWCTLKYLLGNNCWLYVQTKKVGLEVSRAYWAIHGDFWDWAEPENYLHRSWKWRYLTVQSHQSWRGGLVFTWLTLVYNLELPLHL